MANSISGLKKKYSLEETSVRRLNSEYEVMSLRIDYCLQKAEEEKKSFYDLLVFYGELERFTKQLSEDSRMFLRKDIEVYGPKVVSGSFNKNDKTKLAQILFFNSDYVKDICEGVVKEGCFGYDTWGNESVCLHFDNVVVPVNPLKDNELEARREELREMAGEIKDNHYGIKYIFSVS